MIVDFSNVGYKDDPWVLASQVAQVLYVADPAKKTKHIIVTRKQDIIGVVIMTMWKNIINTMK
jgi:hypothetical protein